MPFQLVAMHLFLVAMPLLLVMPLTSSDALVASSVAHATSSDALVTSRRA